MGSRFCMILLCLHSLPCSTYNVVLHLSVKVNSLVRWCDFINQLWCSVFQWGVHRVLSQTLFMLLQQFEVLSVTGNNLCFFFKYQILSFLSTLLAIKVCLYFYKFFAYPFNFVVFCDTGRVVRWRTLVFGLVIAQVRLDGHRSDQVTCWLHSWTLFVNAVGSQRGMFAVRHTSERPGSIIPQSETLTLLGMYLQVHCGHFWNR
jgi:hypothetical protein